MSDIEPIIHEKSVDPTEYLKEIEAKVSLEIAGLQHTDPRLPQKHSSPYTKSRLHFFEMLRRRLQSRHASLR